MKRYFTAFFSLLRTHRKSIFIALFSFFLGLACCFFSLRTIMHEVLNKHIFLNIDYRIIIASNVLAAISQQEYDKAKQILEQDLLSGLISITAGTKLGEKDSNLSDNILKKAYFAFCEIDKERLFNSMNFESEDEKKSFISLIESIDAFFKSKGYIAPAEHSSLKKQE